MRLRSTAPHPPLRRWTPALLPSPIRNGGGASTALTLAFLLFPLAPALAVPLPVPRPDVEAELGEETEVETQAEAAPAPPAPNFFQLFQSPPPPPPAPAVAQEPEPKVADAPAPPARASQPLTIGGKRVAYVPLPEPRPLELDEAEEDAPAGDAPATQASTSTEPQVAPLLVPPPPPSGSQVGRPQRTAPVEAVAGEDLPGPCASLVAQQAMLAVRVAAIESPGACGLPVAVKVSAIRLQDGNLATLQPAAVLACDTAVAVTNWMRQDIGPAIETLGARLETIKVAASYDCRSRNRIRGAQMSEHGRGNAIDVGGFVLSDQRVLEVKKNGLPLSLQTAMKASACEHFTTVLGPGSDGYHEDHIHVDIAQRRLDIRLCRWTIKGPTPPADPAVARATPGGDEEASGQTEAASRRLAEASPIPFPTPRPQVPGDRTSRPKGG